MPDTYWDAEKNTLKVDPAALANDLKERDELKAFKATEDSKRLTLPGSADKYEAKLPDDFKPPEGVTFEFAKDDPLLAQAKTVAHELGVPQAGFEKLLGIFAAAQIQDQTTIAAAKAAEVAKLGVNGPARIDAVLNFAKATVGEADAQALSQMLVTASQVQAFEKLMQKFSSQGGAPFSQSHRTAPDTNEIPGFADMSFEQRRFAQDQQRNRRTA